MPKIDDNYEYYRALTLAINSQEAVPFEDRVAFAKWWMENTILRAPQYKSFDSQKYLDTFWGDLAPDLVPHKPQTLDTLPDLSNQYIAKSKQEWLQLSKEEQSKIFEHNYNVYTINKIFTFKHYLPEAKTKVEFAYLPIRSAVGDLQFIIYNTFTKKANYVYGTNTLEVVSANYLKKHILPKVMNEISESVFDTNVNQLDKRHQKQVQRQAKEFIDRMFDKLYTLTPIQPMATVDRQSLMNLNLYLQPPTYNMLDMPPTLRLSNKPEDHIPETKIKNNVLYQQFYYSIPEVEVTDQGSNRPIIQYLDADGNMKRPFTQLTWFHFVLSVAMFSDELAPMGIYVFYGQQGAGKSNMTSIIPQLLFGQSAREVSAMQLVSRFDPDLDMMRTLTLTETDFKDKKLAEMLYEKLKVLGDYKVMYPLERKNKQVMNVPLDILVMMSSNYLPKIYSKDDRRWFPIEVKKSKNMPQNVLNRLQSSLRHMLPTSREVMDFARYLRWVYDMNINRSELQKYIKTEVPYTPVKQALQEISIQSSKNLLYHIRNMELSYLYDAAEDEREAEQLEAIVNGPSVIYELTDMQETDVLVLNRRDLTFLVNLALSEGARSKQKFEDMVLMKPEPMYAMTMPYFVKPRAVTTLNKILQEEASASQTIKVIDQQPWHKHKAYTKSMVYDNLLKYKEHILSTSVRTDWVKIKPSAHLIAAVRKAYQSQDIEAVKSVAGEHNITIITEHYFNAAYLFFSESKDQALSHKICNESVGNWYNYLWIHQVSDNTDSNQPSDRD
jgi:hypothetical protein